MAIRGVVFDLDGTLVNSLPVTFQAFNCGITRFGGREHTPEEIMSYFGPPEQEIFARMVGRENVQAAIDLFNAHLDENLHEVNIYEGVSELLDSLDEHGIPVAIFTGRTSETTEVILKHHGLQDRFVTVVCGDHVKKSKPSSEGLLLALERMRLKPSEVLFIGDSSVDIRAAREAGAFGVACLWDAMANREELRKHEPHYWIDHPRELLSLIFES